MGVHLFETMTDMRSLVLLFAALVCALAYPVSTNHALIAAAAIIAPNMTMNMNMTHPSENSYKVCGNYCGSGWCDGGYNDECSKTEGGRKCVQKSCHEQGPTDGSCADACCKAHDTCCGTADRTECNRHIVSCLAACPTGSGNIGCGWHAGIKISPRAIQEAMHIVENWCCGEQCW